MIVVIVQFFSFITLQAFAWQLHWVSQLLPADLFPGLTQFCLITSRALGWSECSTGNNGCL